MNSTTYRKKNNNPTPTCIIARSPHVFLNNTDDSLIASFGHKPLIIMSGNEKKVSTFHKPHTIQIIIFPITESSQNLFCKILRIVVTHAFIRDHMSISFI
jgi:hypothetical protein